LLTGDIERRTEKNLLKSYGKRLQSDILVAPHHGSRSSSSMAFVQSVSPDYVLVPAGYRNRWKFPSEEVVKRYQAVGAQILTSAQSGAIEFSIDPILGAGQPNAFRKTYHRYWHWQPAKDLLVRQ